LGVLTAADECLWEYDESKCDMLPEQKADSEVAKSIVDFHVLVNDRLVALIEAKSPTVMHKLGESLPQMAFKIRWTPGSTSFVSRVFSKVGLSFDSFLIRKYRLAMHSGFPLSRLTKDGMAVPDQP
jgi:hypothetical protein